MAAFPVVMEILSTEFDWTPIRQTKEINDAKLYLTIEGLLSKKFPSVALNDPSKADGAKLLEIKPNEVKSDKIQAKDQPSVVTTL